MPSTYQPTSVTRPVPQSVNSQSVPQAGVQTHVVVNVINNAPDYGGGFLRFLFWLLMSPVILFAVLIVAGVVISHPWIILPAVIIGCLWALYCVNR